MNSKQYFIDYTENSTVHGIKYIGEKQRHYVEKIFWIISIIICFAGCAVTIFEIYKKWESNPVLVTLAEKAIPVSQIPFPAITICPMTKLDKKIINFTEYSKLLRKNQTDKLTESQLISFEAAIQICNVETPNFKFKKIGSELRGGDIVSEVENISVKLTDTMLSCSWRGFPEECNELFTEIITEEGFCFTFNMLDLSELIKQDNLTEDFKYYNNNITSTNWTLQDGFATRLKHTYPRRVLGSGERGGLEVILGIDKSNIDYVCSMGIQGFKVILHTPGEIPSVRKQYFRVSPNQMTNINVKPNMITTSSTLKGYSPLRRQCYFDGERELQFYKVYTQSNCEMECIANYTLRKCGCVKFSMPRYNSTEICSLADFDCHEQVEDDLFEDMNDNLDSTDNRSTNENCNCLPACTSIQYDVESSQIEFNSQKVLQFIEKKESDKVQNYTFTILAIYFKEAQFINSKRSELYGWRDFVANCGGILGLFLGMSLVSIVEIFYYLTLRIWCNLKSIQVNPQPSNRVNVKSRF